MKNFLKEKLDNGQTVLGPFLKMNDPALVEQAALAGFDFCIIDMEHGPLSFSDAENLIRAAELYGMSPIIRTSDASEENILRALDIGTHGVQIPQVNTKEKAEHIVRASKYFPDGTRGVCRYTRAAGYTHIPKERHFENANKNTLVLVHIEGLQGLENLDEILEVQGIDIIFLGPYDLSQSCGVPGDINNPVVITKMQEAVNKATKKNIKVGTFVETPEQAKFWRKIGVRYLSYSVDCGIYYDSCKRIIENVMSD